MSKSRNRSRGAPSKTGLDPTLLMDGDSKRRRVKTSRFDFDFLDNEEQRMIQHALKISRLETKREEIEIPDAPTYYPTKEEFLDAMAYVRKIRPEAEQFGICKIVPPAGWKLPNILPTDDEKLFPTKLQQIERLQEGQGFDDGNQYTLQSYRAMARAFEEKWIAEQHAGNAAAVTGEVLAKDYWDMVETGTKQAAVEYGNDLDTSKFYSGFPRRHNSNSSSSGNSGESVSVKMENRHAQCTDMSDARYYEESSWNLNNIAAAPGSLLQCLKTPVNGVNVPWLYVGMMFNSFCWHTEDNYFYSINYSHEGAIKEWYGVPGAAADLFEKVSKEFLLGLFRETPDILHHMTTQISPSLLRKNNVPVYKAHHEPGTFVITFPRSYHGGFSHGFNIGEAVNFATIDWLTVGGLAEERYRIHGRESVCSYQRLLFTLWFHRKDFEKYGLKDLAKEVIRLAEEEIAARKGIIGHAVKDETNIVCLPPNNFVCIDEAAAEYDDMRCCFACKQACIFTAVACQCNQSLVACVRHYPHLCRCSKEDKFMMEWIATNELKLILDEAQKLLTSN